LSTITIHSKFNKMKKVIIIFLVLFNISFAYCQEKPIDEVFTITLPKGTEKLTLQQFRDFSATKFSHTTEYLADDLYYKNNGLGISFRNMSESKIGKTSLESQQKAMPAYLKMNNAITVIDSKIITVNGIKFLIIKYKEYTDNFIRVTSDYDKNNRLLLGHIQYIDSDSTKANQFLQDLLNSMHFKSI